MIWLDGLLFYFLHEKFWNIFIFCQEREITNTEVVIHEFIHSNFLFFILLMSHVSYTSETTSVFMLQIFEVYIWFLLEFNQSKNSAYCYFRLYYVISKILWRGQQKLCIKCKIVIKWVPLKTFNNAIQNFISTDLFE